jgi:hypothetical protein
MAKIESFTITPPRIASLRTTFVARDCGYTVILGCVNFPEETSSEDREDGTGYLLSKIDKQTVARGHDVNTHQVASSLAPMFATIYASMSLRNRVPYAQGTGIVVLGSRPVQTGDNISYRQWQPDFTTWSVGTVRLALQRGLEPIDLTRNAYNFNGDTIPSSGATNTIQIGPSPESSGRTFEETAAALSFTTMLDADWNIGMVRQPSETRTL